MGKSSRREKLKALRKRDSSTTTKRGFGGGSKSLLDLSNHEKVNFFSLGKGKNYLDIIPFEVTSKNYPDENVEIGDIVYRLIAWQHTNIGTDDSKVICLKETYGKKCPICEAQKELVDAGADWQDKEVKALSAKIRAYYNVIDVGDKSETDEIQIFETSAATEWFDHLLEVESKQGEEVVPFYDPEEGCTVVCRTTEKSFNKKEFYKPERIDFEDRDPYPDSIIDEAFPLDAMLKVPTYEEIQKIFLGIDSEDDQEQPKTSRRSKHDEEDEPKEESKRSRRSRKTDEEDQKDEEPKRSRRSRKEPEPEPEPDEENEPKTCPGGLILGVDYNSDDPCQECEEADFEACGDLHDELKKQAEKEEKEEKKSKRKRRR